MEATVVTQITDAITTNLASATGIVTTAGLALIGLAFLSFVLRKGIRTAKGQPG